VIALLLIGFAVVAALSVLGVQLARAILGRSTWLELLGLAYPLGSGVLTWLLFILSWMGLRITALSVAATAAFALAGATWAAENRRRQILQSATDRRRVIREDTGGSSVQVGLGLAFVVLMLAALAISIGRSYAAYDAMAGWALKGYGIAASGSVLAGRSWGMWGLNYPLNIMLQVATFRLFGGDLLPESKLLFPVYLACVCLGIFSFWRRFRVAPALAAAGLMLIATNPVVFIHATNGYANLPFAAILTLGMLAAIDGVLECDPRRQIISGLLLGIGVWTRPEGFLYVALIAVAVAAVARLGRIGRVYPLAFTVPVVGLSVPWLLFALTHYELDPVWIQHGDTAVLAITNLLRGISAGGARLSTLYLIVKLFLERAMLPENWGAYLPVVTCLFVLSAFARRTWARMEIPYLVAASVITIALPVALYLVLSIHGLPDFVLVLRRDFDRAYLPAYFMTNVLAITLLQSRTYDQDPSAPGRPRSQTGKIARSEEAHPNERGKAWG
jgi:hypothetical protein